MHRDIKPKNITIGLGKKTGKLFLIDYGTATSFNNYHDGVHIDYMAMNGMMGSLYYASINSHMKQEMSRRDDLESLAYMIIHMCTGNLPWIYDIEKLTKRELQKVMNLK